METANNYSGDCPIFEICARIEAQTAELYHYYSELFRENPDAAQLWRKTALEEENHLRQFELADRLYRNAGFAVSVDPERAHRVCHKLGTLLSHVRQHPPDLETALSRAIEMEESLADLHMEGVVRFADDSVQKIFKAMMRFDQEHVQSLKRFLAIVALARTEMTG
ncbi:hypothetical protein FO488_09260 [Geobacter sp. FeAm09]|uniref:hypothetical protein n=1 Tax=Geobacter sp. FeAm09 TaxID=2597769 RepID=UPI0011EF6B2E|nr:hypothetical protein [Geobacter sp. FeAm09]QEM68331.1 hypothetical protein FO488_09260 [Geobacter sp. FeAm09]